MEFFYKLFTFLRKTWVILASLVGFALIAALITASYYLRDGIWLQDITNSLQELINAAKDAPGDYKIPEIITTVHQALVDHGNTIIRTADIFWYSGIAFASAFAFVWLFSGLFALIHHCQNK